jgi:nicotinic acid phosphoribosyltransferase
MKIRSLRSTPLADLTVEQLLEKARSTKSDINEHCDKLRELAAQADSVVEFGMRHDVSTVAKRLLRL